MFFGPLEIAASALCRTEGPRRYVEIFTSNKSGSGEMLRYARDDTVLGVLHKDSSSRVWDVRLEEEDGE